MDIDARAIPILSRFGLSADVPGACLGPDRWRGAGRAIVSVNPANEKPLGSVRGASAEDLDAALTCGIL